ncbi:MAG: malonyl-ACP O-methyltransferase BioC [Pseudomonadota bacterium]|nr:malonyl-ACP O-methyltransferase BioC [Pseudomonadota bacterium]
MTLEDSIFLNKRQVCHSFDKAALTYNQHAQLQQRIEQELLERLQAMSLNAWRIADMGAGTGGLSQALRQHYPQALIYSVDLSQQMLKQAQKRVSRWFSRQWMICADAVQLPVADHSIDLIVSNLMLQWCPQTETVFTEWVRILKPEGRLLFSTFGPDTLQELRHSWATVDKASHVNHFWDLHTLGDQLVAAGFKDPVLDIDWLTWRYQTVFQLMQTLKHIGAHNVTLKRPRGLTGKHKLQAMIAAYEHYRLADGYLPVTYEVIYGYALGSQLVR